MPKFSFGGALPKDEILAAADLVKGMLADYLERAAKTHDDSGPDGTAAEGGSGAGSATYVDTDGFVDVGGDDFVDDVAPSADADSKRF